MTRRPHSIDKFLDNWRTNFLRVVSTKRATLAAEKGEAYVASQQVTNLSSGSTIDYAIRTATDQATIVNFSVNVGGRVRVALYEDSSVTDDGSEGTEVFDENLNRETDSSATNDVDVLRDVTVDTLGNQIAVGGAGGSANNAGQNAVPASVVGSPWILKTDTTYIYRVENVSGSSIDLNPTLGYTTKSVD